MTNPQPPSLPPAGWYPDSNDRSIQRYWNGSAWTEHTAPNGAAPTAAAPAPGPAGPSKKTVWWLAGAAALALIVILGAVNGAVNRPQSAGNVEENPAPAVTVTVTPEPEDEAAPEPEPEPEPEEEPAAQDESAVAQAFAYEAHAHLGDMDKDLDDLVVTLDENGFWRLLTNSFELSFNLGQLETLEVPSSVSDQWSAELANIDAGVTEITDLIADERYADVYGAIDGLRQHIAAADKIASSVE